jgi:hypothetical protein
MASPAQPGLDKLRREQGDAGPLSAVQRFFFVSLYLMLLVGVVTVISTGKLDPFTAAVAVSALLIKAWRWRRGLPPEVSEAAARRLTIAYLFLLPLDLFFVSAALAEGSQNKPLFAALLTVIHLLVFALVVRLYSARSTRDHLFLAMVAFALVLVSAILTIDTAFLVFLLLFLLLAVSTFMGLEMRRGAEGAATPPLAAGTPAGKRLARALLWSTTAISLGAVTLAGFIFLLLPRVTAGFLSSYNFQPTIISGFAEGDVQLGQIGQIKQSQAVVMRIKPLIGPLNNAYWRGDALTEFDGMRWSAPRPNPQQVVEAGGLESGGWYDVRGADPDAPRISRARSEYIYRRLRELNWRSTGMYYRVILEPIGSDMVFLATRGTRVRGQFAPGSDRVWQRRRAFLNVDETGSVSNPAHNYSRLVYEGQSQVLTYPAELLREATADYPEQMAARYLQLPELDPRIRQLTEQITAGAPTQYDKVAAVERHLRSEYTYSLELTGESLASFILRRKAGHCEYFASAMAVMLRTIGIPTRYVRGFQAGEYNDVGDDWIVRALNAHSWVEVYFPGFGWSTFDPTPPSPSGMRGMLHRLSLYWDWAELIWIDWVVNYNFAQQTSLSQTVGRQSLRWSRRFFNWGIETYDDAVAGVGKFRRALWRGAMGAPGTFLLLWATPLALLLYLWNRRAILEFLALRFGMRLGRAEELRLASIYYRQMLQLLARHGLAKPPGQTPHEFAAAVAVSAHGAELAAPVQAVTEHFENARYGDAVNLLPQLAAALAALRSLLRRG